MTHNVGLDAEIESAWKLMDELRVEKRYKECDMIKVYYDSMDIDIEYRTPNGTRIWRRLWPIDRDMMNNKKNVPTIPHNG